MTAKMKSFTFLIFGSLTLFLVGADNLSAVSCDRNADGEIEDTSIPPGGGCTVTPDEVHFPIYKFGLCEEIPTYQNYLTACKFLYDSTSGETVAVTTSSNFQLAENVTIDEGTYEATVVLVGNTIKFAMAMSSMQIGMEGRIMVLVAIMMQPGITVRLGLTVEVKAILGDQT